MNSIKRFVISILVVVVALAGTELLASAQNANSSAPDSGISTQNDNMSNKSRSARGRRRAAIKPPTATDNMQTASPGTTQNDNSSNMNRTGSRGRRRAGNMSPSQIVADDAGSMNQTPVRTGRCDPNKQEQTDLSGTYTGKVGYSDAGLSGDATLTINGNNFTLTTGSVTEEGRIVAVTTCNYTAATMQFGKTAAATTGQPSPPPIFSLTVKRTGGGGLILTTAPGEMKQFSFTSNDGGPGGTRRTNRRPKKVAIKPPTVSNNMKNAN